MICLICRQADVLDGFTSIQFERGELHFVISNVPARVCPGCGEAYLEEQTAIRLLQSAEDARKAGVQDARHKYSSA